MPDSSPAPHVIRLRGPWERTLESPPGLVTERVLLPGDWLAGIPESYSGQVRFARSFHRPGPLGGSLAAAANVWLCAHGLPAAALLRLENLTWQADTAGQARQEVTTVLQLRNELTVSWALAIPIAPLLAEVWLEISAPE